MIYYTLTITFILLVFIMPTSRAQKQQWEIYTSANEIKAIAADNNSFWAGTNGGLVEISKTTAETTLFTTANSPLPGIQITSVVVDKNQVK
ncbi:MAG: hypothetical protein Q7U86_11165, partial [Draconibacterium sp.]|nr:hypothetical protein [Draconibacterium sp.]